MADFVTLTCPSCGGRLQITRDIDRFACGHCGNEHVVRRSGGVVALSPVVEGLERIGHAADATASELAIRRLKDEIEEHEREVTRLAGIPVRSSFMKVTASLRAIGKISRREYRRWGSDKARDSEHCREIIAGLSAQDSKQLLENYQSRMLFRTRSREEVISALTDITNQKFQAENKRSRIESHRRILDGVPDTGKDTVPDAGRLTARARQATELSRPVAPDRDAVKRSTRKGLLIVFAVLVPVIAGCLCLMISFMSLGGEEQSDVSKTASAVGEAVSTAVRGAAAIDSGSLGLTDEARSTATPKPAHTSAPAATHAPTHTRTSTATPTPSAFGFVTVTAESVNLRAGPGTDFEVVGSAKQGDELPVFARNEDGSWLQVDEFGETWIAASIVELEEDISAIPTAPEPTAVPTTPPLPAEERAFLDCLACAQQPGWLVAFHSQPGLGAGTATGGLRHGDEVTIVDAEWHTGEAKWWYFVEGWDDYGEYGKTVSGWVPETAVTTEAPEPYPLGTAWVEFLAVAQADLDIPIWDRPEYYGGNGRGIGFMWHGDQVEIVSSHWGPEDGIWFYEIAGTDHRTGAPLTGWLDQVFLVLSPP